MVRKPGSSGASRCLLEMGLETGVPVKGLAQVPCKMSRRLSKGSNGSDPLLLGWKTPVRINVFVSIRGTDRPRASAVLETTTSTRSGFACFFDNGHARLW